MPGVLPARTLTVTIDAPPERVYAFASDGANLPRWAAGLATSVEREGDAWRVASPAGPVTVRFAPNNPFGVLDHVVRLASGEEVGVPMRVVPNGGGSEVLFTLFRTPTMDDARFAADARLVEADLRALKAVLEGAPRGA